MRFSLLLLVILARVASGLEVVESRWGFDRNILRNHFNPLTVTVRNDTSQIYDGEIRCEREFFGKGDEILSQDIYLAPGQSRVVQFIVWMPSEMRVGIAWNGGGVTLDQPKEGGAARVALTTGLPGEGPGVTGWRAFPVEEFPPVVGALDGLGAVEMTSEPRWEAPRRAAFAQWVREGGEVRVSAGGNGRRPVFGAGLEFLNQRPGVHAVGKGRVLTGDSGPGIPVEGLSYSQSSEEENYYGSKNVEQACFEQLAELTRPDVNWTLIFLCTILYAVIVGPVLWRIGRRPKGAWLSLGLFVLTTTLCSWLFAVIGRRGFGETTQLHAFAVANSVGDHQWDVTQYGSLFVTDGGIYRIHYDADSSLFSSGSRSSPGTPAVFRGGEMSVDMPLFSRRPYIHRAVYATEGPKAERVGSDAVKISTPDGWRLVNVFLKRDGKASEAAADAEGNWRASKVVDDESLNEPMWEPEDQRSIYATSATLLYQMASPGLKTWSHPRQILPKLDNIVVVVAELPDAFRPEGDFRAKTQGRIAFVLPLEPET